MSDRRVGEVGIPAGLLHGPVGAWRDRAARVAHIILVINRSIRQISIHKMRLLAKVARSAGRFNPRRFWPFFAPLFPPQNHGSERVFRGRFPAFSALLRAAHFRVLRVAGHQIFDVTGGVFQLMKLVFQLAVGRIGLLEDVESLFREQPGLLHQLPDPFLLPFPHHSPRARHESPHPNFNPLKGDASRISVPRVSIRRVNSIPTEVSIR